MSTLTKLVVDCATGTQKEIPLSAEELAQREADRLAFEAAEAERLAAEAEKAAAKESAITKLEELGLTEAEISALVS
jgi:hypothetical protein